jgi:two-component system response regulator AgrA
MLPIYICEDDPRQLNKLKLLVTQTLESYELADKALIVCAANDPTEIIKHLDSNAPRGLYFLDVELGQGIMSGIELGVIIRKNDPKAYIVMITIHADAAPGVFEYKIEAKDYILKDRTEDIPRRIKDCILNAYNIRKQNIIEYPDFIIDMDKVYYIKAVRDRKRLLQVYGKHSVKQIHTSLNEIEKKLGTSFFKCNRACIINLNYIVSIDKRSRIAIMENGEEIPIPFNKAKELERRFLNRKNN